MTEVQFLEACHHSSSTKVSFKHKTWRHNLKHCGLFPNISRPELPSSDLKWIIIMGSHENPLCIFTMMTSHFWHYWPFVMGIHCSPVDFVSQSIVMWSFAVFLLSAQDKLLNNQWSCWYFEMPWCSCDITVMSKVTACMLWDRHPAEFCKQIHPVVSFKKVTSNLSLKWNPAQSLKLDFNSSSPK